MNSIVSVSAIFSLSVLCIGGGVLYGCESASQRYYDLAQNCTAKGGSFIPIQTNGGSEALCLINQTVSK